MHNRPSLYIHGDLGQYGVSSRVKMKIMTTPQPPEMTPTFPTSQKETISSTLKVQAQGSPKLQNGHLASHLDYPAGTTRRWTGCEVGLTPAMFSKCTQNHPKGTFTEASLSPLGAGFAASYPLLGSQDSPKPAKKPKIQNQWLKSSSEAAIDTYFGCPGMVEGNILPATSCPLYPPYTYTM